MRSDTSLLDDFLLTLSGDYAAARNDETRQHEMSLAHYYDARNIVSWYALESQSLKDSSCCEMVIVIQAAVSEPISLPI